MSTDDSRIVPVSQISKAPRGRKANVNTDLIALIKKVKPGFAADLRDIFGPVDKADRSRVSQTVRTHWKMVHDTKPSVNFSPEGVCQVSHNTRG